MERRLSFSSPLEEGSNSNSQLNYISCPSDDENDASGDVKRGINTGSMGRESNFLSGYTFCYGYGHETGVFSDANFEKTLYKTFGVTVNIDHQANEDVIVGVEQNNTNQNINQIQDNNIVGANAVDDTQEQNNNANINGIQDNNIVGNVKNGNGKMTYVTKFLGNVGGYSKTDSNCVLYSILCQISQDEFKKIVEYVNKYNDLYCSIVGKLRYICTAEEQKLVLGDFSLSSDEDSDNFLKVLDRSKIALKKKYREHANYIRAGILLKQIEIKLRPERVTRQHSNDDLGDLVRKAEGIDFSFSEACDFFSAFGYNMIFNKFNKNGGMYSSLGSVHINSFTVKAIAELLSKNVFVYITESWSKPKPIGFIFGRPDIYSDCTKELRDGEFIFESKNNRIIEESRSFFGNNIGTKERQKNGNTIFLCHVSAKDSIYTIPLGLNDKGVKYSYRDLDKYENISCSALSDLKQSKAKKSTDNTLDVINKNNKKLSNGLYDVQKKKENKPKVNDDGDIKLIGKKQGHPKRNKPKPKISKRCKDKNTSEELE